MAISTTATTTRRSLSASRATQRRPASRPATRPANIAPDFTTLAGLARHLRWLQGQARDVDENVADLTHTACQMGEASDWQDARLPQLDETISFWQGRYEALCAQMRDARALYVHLLVTASPRA